MKRTILGTALLAGFGLLLSPGLSAQRVAVDLSWRSGTGVRVAASYAAPSAYLRAGYRHCEPSGAYVYCWDTRAHRFRAPLAIHVFHKRAYRPAPHSAAARRAARIDRRSYERHARAAHRAWQRWYRQYYGVPRYRHSSYDGRRVIGTPAIAVRLAFHI